MKKKGIKLFLLTIILIFGIAVFPTFVTSVTCNTAEFIRCPDGSYVTHDPNNNCIFSPCPGANITTKPNQTASSNPKCTETDVGKDYENVGTINAALGFWKGSVYYTPGSHTDQCIDSWTLKEYYCLDTGSYGIEEYKCQKICRENKCIDVDLQVACPSVPCDFKGIAIKANFAGAGQLITYDSPPSFISALYPYQFNLENTANVTMTLYYRIWANTNGVTNALYVKVDGKEVYTDKIVYSMGSPTNEKTAKIELGNLEVGEHFIETYGSPLPNYYVTSRFKLEKVDIPPVEIPENNDTNLGNESELSELNNTLIENETITPQKNQTQENETNLPEQNETIQINETIEENETQPPQQNETLPTEEEPPINGGCPPDKALICHKNKNDICVAQPAVAAHLDHGDYEGSCANEKTDTKEIVNVKANDNVNLEFNNSVKVSFKSLNVQQDSIVITARVRDVPPQATPPPIRKVKKYLIIDHPDIDNSEISDSKLEFTIGEDWLIENNAKKESVILTKFVDNYWKDLRTKYTKSVNNMHYYEAESEGFSTFAITLNNTVAPVKETEETEQKPVGEDKTSASEKEDMTSKFLTLPYLIGASIIVLFFVFVLLMPPPKKKQETPDPEKEKYKEVIDFIAELKKKNKSQDEIEKELSNAGWSKEDIKKLIKLTSEKNK